MIRFLAAIFARVPCEEIPYLAEVVREAQHRHHSMSYLVFARKYRPKNFSEVSGQEHVTRTLSNAIARDRVAHAYVLTGPRGVGKTSIARIFAKSLNCSKGATAEPCGECNNCIEIVRGTHLSVREIDGASHNSVDNVRELIESFRALPAPGTRYKVYIIDEVHMLSTAAFNALLKSLEEPPPFTVFILATTEVHKIPDTVLSRCQRFDLRALGFDVVAERLRAIATAEGVTVEPEALRTIARISEGSMRDAQTLFDRVQAYAEGPITALDVSTVLGVVERTSLRELVQAILEQSAERVLQQVQAIFSVGIDPTLFLRELVTFWRDLLIARFGDRSAHALLGLEREEIESLRSMVADVAEADLQDLVELARTGADSALRSSYPKQALESLVVRLATREKVVEIGQLIARFSEMREPGSSGQRGGAAPGSGSPSRQPDPSRTGQPKGPPAAPTKSVSPRVEAPAASQESVSETEPQAVSWVELVKTVSTQGGMMLGEHLKRLSIETFSPGILKAHGPELSISYLSRGDAKARLQQYLAQITKVPQWSVTLQSRETKAHDKGTVVEKSLHEQEKTQREEVRKERARDIIDHPTVKNLQKVFPGSTIEAIKIRE